MSHVRSFRTILASAFILVAGLLVPTLDLTSQVLCECTASQEKTAQLTVCIGGVNREVKVAYCNTSYCPPKVGVQPCNPGNLPINARTVIRRICVVDGGALVTDPQVLLNATVSAMGICCSGYRFFPECQHPPAPFHWIVSWPKCAKFDVAGQCLIGCDNSRCCTHLVRFIPSTTGDCTTTVLRSCEDPGECSSTDCIRLECRYPIECCW